MLSLFKVDYNINDMAKYEADKPLAPAYVLANDLEGAFKKALTYESDNLKLIKCEFFQAGVFVCAKGVKI